jgi:hypothetical protein
MDTDNIKDEAHTMIWSRLSTAELDLQRAKDWDGRGHLDTDESFEETKEAHIEMARRRVNIYHYLLTLIEQDDK